MATYFNSMPVNKNTELPDFTGCCNGGLKVSYVVSAPLHMKGIWQFWFSNDNGWLNKVAVIFDLIIHLALWITPLVMEIWGNGLNKGGWLVKELYAASLWALITAWVGIFIAQVFAFWGQDVGRLYPSTYGLIVGGAYASILFNVIYYMQALTAVPGFIDTDDDAHNEMAQLRKQTLWTIALKFIAVATLKQNAAFWGPCSTDVVKEKQEQLEQTKKDYGYNKDGSMAADFKTARLA